MRYIAGVDIGNSTTEVCVAAEDDNGLRFLSSACGMTTGLKCTVENIKGIRPVLDEALKKAGIELSNLNSIRLNEAAPVIGDTSMETIRATIITDSAMIGHDPDTPAGAGCATGILVRINNLADIKDSIGCYMVIVPKNYAYAEAAAVINTYMKSVSITALILEQNEAVLVWNRLLTKIPVIDEVAGIEKIPEGRLAAIEVAPPGETLKALSNPYGIASLLKLNAEDTKKIALIAKSLIGCRSGIVIKSPHAVVIEESVRAGRLVFVGERITEADVDSGADEIMSRREEAGELSDVRGEENTNIGRMLNKITAEIAELIESAGFKTGVKNDVHITDFFAVDTFVPRTIAGGLAGETCPEKAVAAAAMVRSEKAIMNRVAERLHCETGVHTNVAGIEAVMAVLGALTTPGVSLPLAVLDLGGGSVDAAIIDESGTVRSTHFAGAGQLVTLIIANELSIGLRLAEQVKRLTLAKAESLFHLRLESGNVIFPDKPLPPSFFGHNILISDGEYINTGIKAPTERIADIRRTAKHRVFVRNAIRALKQIAPMGKLDGISSVALVGGSALDFEIPDMIARELLSYSIICGRASVRGVEGPRNAVATGLVMPGYQPIS